MTSDPRTTLAFADRALREGRVDDAVRGYLDAGRLLAARGFALKAVAVLRQVVEIAAAEPRLAAARAEAWRGLVEGYDALGLRAEAAEARKHLG
jgi:hypothetical protein